MVSCRGPGFCVLSGWSVFLQLICDNVTRMFGAIDMYVLDKKSRQAECRLKKRSACHASLRKNHSYQLVHQIGLSTLIKEGGILKGTIFSIYVCLNHVLTTLSCNFIWFCVSKLSVTQHNATDFWKFNVGNTEYNYVMWKHQEIWSRIVYLIVFWLVGNMAWWWREYDM